MKTYTPSTYGDHIADFYDHWSGVPTDTEETVDLVRRLAGAGPILELGIGTGRVALPLCQVGLEVHGIDASPAMLARLRDKPGGKQIHTVVGDFADVGDLAPGRYSVVYTVFSTFFGILSQPGQVRCFKGVADRLNPGGVFLLEAFVPDPDRFDGGQRTETIDISDRHALVVATQHDAAAQRSRSHFMFVSDAGIRLFPIQVRYAWPSELDLMGELAMLHLESRWAGWNGECFQSKSERHVSIYRKPHQAGPA